MKKRKIKITLNAPTTLLFVTICLAALILGMVTGGATTKKYFMTYHGSFADPLTFLRLFTHVFGHANLDHFMGNMGYILLLGPLLEEKYGSRKIWLIIFLTAVTTGLVNYFFFPGTALLGRSGVVFAFIILSSITGIGKGEIPMTFILVAVIYIGQQVYQGLFVADNIANFAHIIGGGVGAIIGFNLNGRR